MKRILFVDDETAVLEGLRNVLRPLRSHWSMRFATGGQQALEALGTEPADVVVSDMRMPGMDGLALLAQVNLLARSAAPGRREGPPRNAHLLDAMARDRVAGWREIAAREAGLVEA